MGDPKRILIVGGVAGGATCATRIRRLDERARIVVFERGPWVSYANCGLPYYIGNVIPEENSILQATPDFFARRFRVEARVNQEVTAIDRAGAAVEVRETDSGRVYREPYDALVLAPGAAPLRPAVAGLDLPGVFTLRTPADARAIRDWVAGRGATRAVIVGAGFIGLEMAENLALRGLKITVVEMLPQVLAPLDPEMAEPVSRHLEANRVAVYTSEAVERIADGPVVRTQSGRAFAADLVVVSAGVRPETGLALDAGLAIGATGGIRVDDSMRTSDPNIWAVGDAVEVRDFVTGQPCLAPLAGPAHRQARVAADSICGRPARFRGVQATAVCGFFGMTAAMTGASEKALRRAGLSDFEAVYLHPRDHAAYFPNAKLIAMKLIFARAGGRILGAQAVGEAGVAKRIDVISLAIQKGATVFDLEESELCYAPQYGAAKDPVNLAGMAAANILRGDVRLADWPRLASTDALIVDVRDPDEFAAGHIDGAVHIPLDQLRERLGELPRDREIWIYCRVGQRAYYALRVLLQNGYDARTLAGGYQTYWGWYP